MAVGNACKIHRGRSVPVDGGVRGGAGSLCLTGMAVSTGTITKRGACWRFSSLGLTAGFWREAARLSVGGLWGGEFGRNGAFAMIWGMDKTVGVYM